MRTMNSITPPRDNSTRSTQDQTTAAGTCVQRRTSWTSGLGVSPSVVCYLFICSAIAYMFYCSVAAASKD